MAPVAFAPAQFCTGSIENFSNKLFAEDLNVKEVIKCDKFMRTSFEDVTATKS